MTMACAGGPLEVPRLVLVVDDSVREQLLGGHEDRRSGEGHKMDGFGVLPRREAEVMRLIMNGMSADTIASTQFVGMPTVRTQIRSILKKLGVQSQLQAAA